MENVLCKDAGGRIRSTRKSRGMTRDALAEKSGISSKFLYEIEQGKKRFSAETLCRIANTLDVSCDYIMSGKLIPHEDETGIAEVIALFDSEQQRKMIPILKELYQFIK